MAPPTAASPVLVSGCAGDTRRYRAWHAAEAMALAGRPIRVRTVETDPPSAADLAGAPVLILHRVAWHPDVDGWMAAVRAGGGIVLYDTDDLVFDAHDARDVSDGPDATDEVEAPDGPDASRGARPDFVPHAAAARSMAAPAHHRRVLIGCDGCIVSTAPLAAAVERLGVPAWVVPNAIDLELWRLSCDALARRPRRGDGLVIGYASGTPTHDRDLAVCAAAVQSVLAAEPRARFRLIGPLTLDASWAAWASRIERVDHMPWRDLPAALADLDVNVAPLVVGDAFCEAKSALKWFEAGAVGVPTVASATAAFRDTIRDGRDGFVAATPDEWRAALLALAADGDRRAAVGLAARAAVLDAHLTDVRGAEWLAAVDGLARGATLGRSMGVAAAAARDVVLEAEAGVDVAIEAALTGSPAPSPVLVLDDDPTVARGPMGAEALAAERALRSADRVGALGPWLAARLTRFAPAAVAALPYPIDTARFCRVGRVDRAHGEGEPGARSGGASTTSPARPTSSAPPARPVVLCDLGTARDSTRRLALAALHIAADTVPSLPVRLFTSDAAAPPPDAADLDRPGWRWLGAHGPDARASLFARDAVLVAPHFGNLPTVVLEAMACGVAVAAVDVPAVRWLLNDGGTACLGRPQPDLLAGAIVRLVRDEALRDLVSEAGRAAVERHSAGRCSAAVSSLAAGVPSSARATAPWARQLDRLQPRGGDLGEPLVPGRTIGLAVIARRNGACRIDLRVVCRAEEAGRLRLTVAPGLPAAGIAPVRTATADREGRSEEWLSFRFAPLPESAGRWWTFDVSMSADAQSGPSDDDVRPVRLFGIRGTVLADAHGVVDHAVTDAWSPSFRLWAEPPASDGALLPDGHGAALADALDLTAAEAGECQRTERAVAELWPMRCFIWLAGRRPLPRLDRRPWPPDAPIHAKVLGTLRHYGPLALAREVRAMGRWRGLDEAARAAAVRAVSDDQNTA